MKNLILACLFSCTLLAQGNYTEGYFITTDGVKTEALVKRFKISENPNFIAYKLNKDADFENILVKDLKEVSPNGKTRYFIAEVDIDNTPNNLRHLTEEARNDSFNFEEKTLFLEILVNGKATLYKSFLDSREKFFYKIGDGNVEQLLYKKYMVPTTAFYIGNDHVKENNYYHRQLYRDLPCVKRKNRIDYPDYNDRGLKAYFKRYNKGWCK